MAPALLDELADMLGPTVRVGALDQDAEWFGPSVTVERLRTLAEVRDGRTAVAR